MAMALSAGYETPSDVLSKLVVVDVSPIKGKISKQFRTYIDTLKEMEGQGIKSRKEANDYLARIEPVSNYPFSPPPFLDSRLHHSPLTNGRMTRRMPAYEPSYSQTSSLSRATTWALNLPSRSISSRTTFPISGTSHTSLESGHGQARLSL
jgi:hypothetical protein